MPIDFDQYRSRVVLRDLLRRLPSAEAAALRSFVREIEDNAFRKGILASTAILHAGLEYEIDLDRAVECLITIAPIDDAVGAEASIVATSRQTLTQVA